MHDDGHDNIFADDDALDFILYEEIEKQDQELKGGKDGKGGCFGIVVLLLLPAASVMLLSWK